MNKSQVIRIPLQTLTFHQSDLRNPKMISSSSVLIIGCLLSHIYICCAQNSPQDFLDAHNAARADVGVGPMTWDNTVAAYAHNYADQRIADCSLKRSGGEYGENVAWGTSLTGTGAVELWLSEKAYYAYNSNTCATGLVCSHYTQIVWRYTVRLGCARVQCNDERWFIICNYDPPGNQQGLRPYTKNDSHSSNYDICLIDIHWPHLYLFLFISTKLFLF